MKVKVCGMKYLDNIQDVAALGVDYLGFIFYEKSARFVAELPKLDLPASIQKVGVFVNSPQAYVEEKIASGLDAIQLHGAESPSLCEALKKHGLPILKAFGIGQSFDWASLRPYVGLVDYFLFDTKSKSYGGTGQTFDWSSLEAYPYETAYFLSGGLSVDNIHTSLSIHDKRLIGLDLNSRFEIAPALKDVQALNQALKIIRQ